MSAPGGPPKRLGLHAFDPGNGTRWPSPDLNDPDLAEVPQLMLNPVFNAYCDLLEHPCGLDMLRTLRRGWKRLRCEERAR